MTDRLTAEDAARLLEGSTPGPWFTESDGIGTRSLRALTFGRPFLRGALNMSVDTIGLFNWSNVKDWMLSVSGHGLGYETQTVASPTDRSGIRCEVPGCLRAAQESRLQRSGDIVRVCGEPHVYPAEGSDVLPTDEEV